METCYVVVSFECVDEILWCDHSNEISFTVPSHGTICLAGFEKLKIVSFLEFLFWPLLGVKELIRPLLYGPTVVVLKGFSCIRTGKQVEKKKHPSCFQIPCRKFFSPSENTRNSNRY